MTDQPAPLPPAEPTRPAAPPPTEGMQFDRAESLQPSLPATACVACKRPVTDVYYLAGNRKVCPACREAHEAQLAGGSKAGRVIKALALGVAAAGVGGAGWAFITYTTNGIYGIVAVGLGLLIGAAVRMGAERRGGRGYQAMAMALTYLGVAIGYSGAMIPMAFKEKSAAPAAAAAEKPEEEKSATPAEPAKRTPTDSPGTLAGGCLIALVTILGIFVASPVLIGIQDPFTFVFLAIALYEAWKLNRGTTFRLAGPFRLGGSASGNVTGG